MIIRCFLFRNLAVYRDIFCELMKNIPSEHQFKLSLLFSDNFHLKENYDFFKKIDILGDQNFKGKYFIQKKLSWLNHFYSRRCISANNFDLFHPTYYNDYFLKSLKKPFIITVHDLILFKFENTFFKLSPLKQQMESVIKKANRIIAISENTRKDLIEILNINPDKIDVIYHGYNKTVTYKKLQNYGRYILFVGRRSLYKNFLTFAKAVIKLLNKEKDLNLVCVGPAFNAEETAFFEKFDISDQVIAVNVDDDSLNSLYSNALVFVFPSLYEGFGMPILEAFANSCPVCLSNTSCFPEIAENAGVYFDPYSQESILDSIEKVIYDKGFADKMVQAGQRRVMNFSWEKTARETISSYQKTI